MPEGYKHYLITFGMTDDEPEVGAVEAAYALMVGAAGITMPATRLFETPDGGRYFGATSTVTTSPLPRSTLGGLFHASHSLPSSC